MIGPGGRRVLRAPPRARPARRPRAPDRPPCAPGPGSPAAWRRQLRQYERIGSRHHRLPAVRDTWWYRPRRLLPTQARTAGGPPAPRRSGGRCPRTPASCRRRSPVPASIGRCPQPGPRPPARTSTVARSPPRGGGSSSHPAPAACRSEVGWRGALARCGRDPGNPGLELEGAGPDPQSGHALRQGLGQTIGAGVELQRRGRGEAALRPRFLGAAD